MSELAEAFERTCRDRRADAAVLWLPEARAIRFGDLWQQHERIRQALQRHGVRDGATVVSLVGNHPIFFPLVAACMQEGAALLPLGEATAAEAAAVVDRSGAAAIVTDRLPPVNPDASTFLDAAASTELDHGLSIFQVRRQSPARSYGRSIIVKLTSGSTDLPKATIAGEAAVLRDGRNIAAGMSIGSHDMNMAVIPLSHAYAIGNIVVPLLCQGTAAALRLSFSPTLFLDDVRASGATVFPGVPFMFDRLREPIAGAAVPSSLRQLISAGARIDPDTVRWFHRRGLKIHSFYGASETGGITFDETDDLPDPLHVGRPLPGVSIELLPQAGVPQGGRVFVRAGGMAFGYATLADSETESPFVDGGFRTGDLGYLNTEGRLVLTGRVSPLVNVAGRKVDPAEVERVLVALPDVHDARVVGVECRTRGQELVAFVVRAGTSLTPIALRRSCAQTLSPYKIPRRFIFLEEWPVDGRGKVDRRALEALASDA